MKNKIKIYASRIEKMADSVATQTVTASYADLEDFTVSGYTLRGRSRKDSERHAEKQGEGLL